MTTGARQAVSSDDDWEGLLRHEAYPRSSRYPPRWIMERQMGPNALWLAESLTEVVALEAGTKVLDLGCGKAMTSVFLAREFGVEVWAADHWVPVRENEERIEREGLSDVIHAVQAEAHSLPFRHGLFDAIVSLDAYQYFGTDELYIGYLRQFLAPEAPIGVVMPGFRAEPGEVPPPELAAHWEWDMCVFHSPDWWRRHWEKTGLVAVERADLVPHGRDLWLRWERAATLARSHHASLALIEGDVSRRLDFVRLVGRAMPPAALIPAGAESPTDASA